MMKRLIFFLFFTVISCNEKTRKQESTTNYTKSTDTTEIKIDTTNFKENSLQISICPAPTRKKGDPYSIYEVEKLPEFKNTPQNLTKDEAINYFKDKVSEFVNDNFLKTQGDIDLSGKHRIYILFVIDTLGNISDVKTRSTHEILEKEAKRVARLFPKFIPAKHEGKNVKVEYILPIIFQIEDK